MDIAVDEITSGVDRHIDKLLEGLKNYPYIHVYRIQLLYSRIQIIQHEDLNEFYTKITLPLPQNYKEIVEKKYWIRKCNEHIFHIIKGIFPKTGNCLLHLHTINLIDLAILIRQQIHCKIITHLHCIPWKEYYNSDEKMFNYLYHSTLQSKKDMLSPALFITNESELASYTQADQVIVVTKCGADFLQDIMKIPQGKITVIHNGINDYAATCRRHFFKDASSRFQCLFIANMSKSKGLDFIFRALRTVQKRGYDIELNVAGYINPAMAKTLKTENNDLNINIMGRLSFDQLIELYKSSDIGLIASLQEQWSLVAVEMAMFGLPIVTTAVDGLNELFTDDLNALKVHTIFSETFGLSVDVNEMAEKIIRLIEHKELRMNLSKNVRDLYENELVLQNMMQQIVSVYQKTIGDLLYE